MKYRFLSVIFGLFAVAASLAAGSIYFLYPGGAKAELLIEEPERVFKDLVANRVYDVEFRVVNTGGRTGRVIGAPRTCLIQCCFGPKENDLTEIPAHGSSVIVYQLEVRKAGPFECKLPLYLDDGVLREVTLSIRGEAVEEPKVSQ